MSARTYGQYCGIATALDVVGDRWALLVIRELLPGPRRYTDLQAGLPGIATDVLAARLRRLEDDGLVERLTLPPPAASKVYALTQDGRSLEPVLLALAEWGLRRLPAEVDGAFRPAWFAFALRALFRPAALRDDDTAVIDLDLGGEGVRARIAERTLLVEERDGTAPDVVVRGDIAAVAALVGDRTRRAEALASGRVVVEGDPGALAVVQRAFGLEP